MGGDDQRKKRLRDSPDSEEEGELADEVPRASKGAIDERSRSPARRYDDDRSRRRRSRSPDDRHRRRRRSRSRSKSPYSDYRRGYDDDYDRQPSSHKKPLQPEAEEEEDDEEFQARVAAALEANEDDEERLIEERRRRRQEILAKYKQQQPSTASQPSTATNGDAELLGGDDEAAAVKELGVEAGGQLNIWADKETGSAQPLPQATSATIASGIGEVANTEAQQRVHAHLQGAAATVPAAAADDEMDMFADTPEDVRAARQAAATTTATARTTNALVGRPGLQDNYDDAEGYYNFQIGEVLNNRFEVYAVHGRGVFSSVLRARDLLGAQATNTAAAPTADNTPLAEVAIKVIRSNETMYKAGQMEKVILRKLAGLDPNGRRHTITMLGSFEYRNHLCLVFEPMDMNLRELTKRYGRGIGLSISAVRIYTQQMLVALYHLNQCGVLHADIKPDNILVNEKRTVVKICDFGSAMFSGDNEITPYLCSRFYRPPEVMLGLPYDFPMDMWSIGCVVYELFTGRILFPGKTNNEMLKLMMDVKGPFPKKMLKRGEFSFKHFEPDANMSFALIEEDRVTKQPVRRLISNPSVKQDFNSLLSGQSTDRVKLSQLVDLLDKMMALDPDKRITPKDALKHPFIKDLQAASQLH